MATPVRTRRRPTHSEIQATSPVTPAKPQLPVKNAHSRAFKEVLVTPAKTIAASLAALETPKVLDASSPVSVKSTVTKKQKSPEKILQKHVSDGAPTAALPPHYHRVIEDLRILDETLSLFRIKNQIPFFPIIKENIERSSKRRFTLDNLRQLMTASEGKLFKVERQEMKDAEGRVVKIELTVRAVHDCQEIFKRLTSEQSQERQKLVEKYLRSKAEEYLAESSENNLENAYPIKPWDLSPARTTDAIQDTPKSSSRTRVLSRCDSVASDGSIMQTPKSSLRRQLSVSASPIVPNVMPQLVTPVKLKSGENSNETTPAAPLSAKDKLEAIRNRIKAREADDAQQAVQYDKEMSEKEVADSYDLCVKLLIKLNHKFPRGITTAKISTLTKDYGSLFVSSSDVEKWTRKICDMVPQHFCIESVGNENVLKYLTPEVKFSAIKKSIEDMKLQYQVSIKE